jgi:outer membrane autotransporter protein
MVMATVADEQRRASAGKLHLWGGPIGGAAWTDGRAADGTADRRTTGYGGELGLGGEVRPGWTAGFVGAGAHADYRVNGRVASGEIDSFHAAAYSAVTAGTGYLRGAIAYGHYSILDRRNATDGVTAETERATLKGGELRARGEVGVTLPFGRAVLVPFVGAEYAKLWIDGFQEQGATGASALPLAGRDQSITSLPAFAGLRLSGGAAFHPYVEVEYRHEFRQDRNAALSLVSLPEAAWTIAAARPAADAVHGALGVEAALSSRLSLYAGADGTASDGYDAVNGRAGLRIAF